MAIIYVRSTDGNNADNGSTWALAKADGAGAAAIDSAGDTIYFSDAHAESTAGNVSWALAGTSASPVRLIGADDAAEPPTATGAKPTITTTGTSAFVITGVGWLYWLKFLIGDGVGSSNWNFGSSDNTCCMTDCDIELPGTGTGGRINIANGSRGNNLIKGCTFKFANTSQALLFNNPNLVSLEGCSIASGSSAITNLIDIGTGCGTVVMSGCDWSNGAAAMNITSSTDAGCLLILRNCKLPASWTGSPHGGTVGAGTRIELHNCDDGDTNYSLWIKDYNGSIVHETTIVRTGGASDGSTSLSWKMATLAGTQFPDRCLHSPEIVRWNETTGSAITVTVEIVHDSQGSGTSSAFTDKEIWLEVMYLGTSGVPLGTFIDDAAADIFAAAADQTSSSETWTTTGLTTPVKQKLSVTFTPQEKGHIHAVVHMAGASDTAYICPKLTIS